MLKICNFLYHFRTMSFRYLAIYFMQCQRPKKGPFNHNGRQHFFSTVHIQFTNGCCNNFYFKNKAFESFKLVIPNLSKQRVYLSVTTYAIWNEYKTIVALISPLNVRAYPHQKKSCLFRQMFCHHQHFTRADGLPRPEKFCPKQTNLQRHRQQNLSRIKPRQNQQHKQNCVKLVNHVS